ncbi:MAG: hypothetical protein JXN61_16805 [Sedimentisphaerales bacterium]|nr:hypothetical protein [Sedimentisphaerales bacterium]
MKMKGYLAAAILLTVGVLLPSTTVYGYQYLTVNGIRTSELILDVGEPVSIEINSTNSDTYLNLIGFEVETPAHELVLLEIRPEAGTLATAEPVHEPNVFYEYAVRTISGPGPIGGPSPGMHFVFELTVYEEGVADLVLSDMESILDNIHIIVATAPALLHVPAEYATIQAAINAAYNGDQIEVATGIYYEAINFNGKAVKLYSGGGPEVTTIDGTGHFHVVQCVSGEGPDTVLEGFTITGGNANGTGSDTYGGGMYNYSSSPTVTNCIFQANRAADRGGGMYNTNGSSPHVVGCVFTGNKGYVRGSGMCNWSSSPTVVNCTFIDNTETIYGGGMSNNYSSPTVTNCTFRGNSAIHCGGMHNDWSSPTVTNSIFFNNAADVGYNGTSGGMGQSNYSFPKLTNCTFTGNVAYYGGATRSTNDSAPILVNCILWGDTSNIDSEIAGPANVTYSDIRGGWAGAGNINADPLFKDPDLHVYRLSSSASPCVDAGDNTAPDLPIKDFEGSPRIMDGDGNGSAIVDMGAYELTGGLPDTQPPIPNPSLSVEPNGVMHNQLTLICTEAFDPSGVEYYFECVSGPGHDSGWVTYYTYTDTLLEPEMSYAYRVKARDGLLNETSWSPTLWVDTESEPAVTDGLLAYWPMEDGYGSMVSDWSGNGNNGFFSNSTQPVWQPFEGRIGGSLLFDGGEGHVVCPELQGYDFQLGLTAMAWIKTDSLTKDWQAILTRGDTAWRLHRYMNTDYINFACTGLMGGNEAWGSSATGSTPVVDNEWHHVAGVYNPYGETHQVVLYVDGVPDGPEAAQDGYGSVATNPYDVFIGANAEMPGRGWNGLIDDVRLYDDALTEWEIAYLIGEYVEPDRSLLAHWALDESAGTVAADSSWNNHDGFLSSGPAIQWVPGYMGIALSFPGGDYADCGNSSMFDVTAGISVAAWVNINTVPADWTAILTKGDEAWRLSTDVSTTKMHFAVTGAPDYWAAYGTTELTPGYWHHVVGTYDGSHIRLYIDGVEDAGPVPYDGGVTTSQANVWIGGNSGMSGREFDGMIDEAAVWNRALSPEEIQWIAANQIVQRTGIYVDDDAPDDPAPGDPSIGDPDEDGSWNHPFDSIQEGIDAADSFETVIVRDGIYSGWGNRSLSFNGKPMLLRSENGPKNCIINCERMRRGFYFVYEEGEESVLEGFTIANGRAYTEGLEDGGGIYCYYSSPTIRDCIIRNCEGRSGGGICLEYSNALIDGCVITANNAVYYGGGIECRSSNPTLAYSTIRNNSPDGISLNFGSARISGTVNVISDSIVGDAAFQIDPDATLQMENATIAGYTIVQGLGRILVPAGNKLTVVENALIDLTDGDSPGIRGTVQCDGLLVVGDSGSLNRTAVDVTRAIFQDYAIITNNVFSTNVLIPYGQISLENSAIFFNNDVYSKGDRYIDVEPETFTGAIENNRIFVTTEEGRGNLPGGLFELRGQDMFCEQSPCEPGLFELPTVPDFDPATWTIERLELRQGAKLTLTNRDDYQPPYQEGGEAEVLYVKQLVLGEDSVLDTAFNRMYYESLSMHSTARIINRPLLGYSLDDIVFDSPDEYSNRVFNNNLVNADIPGLTRVHIERTVDSQLDPIGLMLMHTLPDLDPASPTYQQVLPARAKGLFARCTEEMVTIRFNYKFETYDPDVRLEVYLSDVPDLLEEDDPERLAHYRLVGILEPPPYPRPGSADSGRFAVFEKTVPTEGLDLTDGTFVELELIQPGELNPIIPPVGIPFMKVLGSPAKDGVVSGTTISIDDWGPEVHCDGICLDVTRDYLVDEVDFLTVVGECGLTAELDPCDTGSRACLEGAYSDDSYVDVLDITGWDWTLGDDDRGYLCDGIPLSEAEAAKEADLKNLGNAMPLAIVPSSLDDLLIIGKRKAAGASVKMQDRLYTFDATPTYSASFTPSSSRSNLRIVQGTDDTIYQVNSEDGVIRLNATDDEIIPPGVCTNVTEPRYSTSGATVYVGIQLEPGHYEDESTGRPILDAAFDEDYAYVVPVVVEPVAEDAYVAAAKLQLLSSGSPPYQVVKIYDDPPLPADNQYRNSLREIEIDDEGNIYVVNAHGLNESNILWRYQPSGAYQRVELGVPGTNNYVPDPVALYISNTTDMLYMASGQHDAADYRNSTIYGFTTVGTMTCTRKITVNSMHHVTGITEDPATGTLYVVGFTMDNIPEFPDETAMPFYEARFAKIPYGSTSATAQALAGSHDLAMPMSVLWTKTIKCGGANIAGDGSVNFLDLAIIGQYWLDSSCSPPDWCGGADIDMSTAVGMTDVAILADNWLETYCAD